MIKKYLLLLLLFALPFQIAWSAASVYCQHDEIRVDGPHFGHHFHAHHATSLDNKSGNSPSKNFHHDCGFCHASHSISEAPRAISLFRSIKVKQISPGDYLLHYTSFIPKGLDRPDWHFVS